MLRRALDRVWDFADGNEVSTQDLEALLSGCESVAPDTTSAIDPWISAALNAANAACASLESVRDRTIGPAIEAGTLVTETIYLALAGHILESDPELWAKTVEHPVMKGELERQSEDLAALASDVQITAVREKATRSGTSLLADLRALLIGTASEPGRQRPR